MYSEIFRPYLSLAGIDAVVILLSIYMLIQIVTVMRRGSPLPLPPGPRPIPLVGNIFDFPRGHEGPHWAKHKAIYGNYRLCFDLTTVTPIPLNLQAPSAP